MSCKISSRCAIYGCKNKNQQKLRKHIFFYRFPKARDVAQKWVNACNRRKLINLLKSQEPYYLFKKQYMVCSDHFEWKCFKDKNLLSKGLIKTAIPTKNLYPKSKAMKSCSENLVEIDEIKIKVEPQICHGCLSIDRRTSTLGNFNEILNVLIGPTISFQKESLVYFCWECMAVLRKLHRFQNQFKLAQDSLKLIFHDSQSLSNLTIFQKNYYDQEIEHSEHATTEFHDYKDDIYDRKDDLQSIKKEHLKNDNIKLNDISNSVETERDDNLINYNVDFDDPIDEDTSKSEREVKVTDSSNKTNIKVKRKLKSLKNIKKEYKSYAKHICHKDWRKPYTQYFTKVYLDEADIETSFLKKDRKRQGFKMSLKCKTCSLIYSRKIDFDRHNNLNHHKPNTPFRCLHCKEVQPSLETLKEHWRSHSAFYKCNMCSRVMFPCSLALHLSRSHVNVYVCTNCTMSFSSLVSFSEHYNKNHPFVCDYCNKKCALRSVLEKHIKNHHIPQQCIACDRNFDTNMLYRAHCREMHPALLKIGVEPEMCYCVECDRQFPSRTSYMKHVNSKHSLKVWKPKTTPCPECGKNFNKNSDMLLHYNFSHVKVTKYHCDLCDKYFLKSYGLRTHMESVHLKLQKPKNKICDLCGRAFLTNAVLSNHRRTHTGERPFKCEVCPAAFAQKGAMKIHQRKQHDN